MSSAAIMETDKRLRELLLRDETVREMISLRAYEIYKNRGETHGYDREDWLQAESEIIEHLIGQHVPEKPEAAPPDFAALRIHETLTGYDLPVGTRETLEPPAPSHQEESLGETAAVFAKSLPFSEPSEKKRKKNQKPSKSPSSHKHKNASKVAINGADPTPEPAAKDKKSGHKEKGVKKKKKNS